MQVRHDFKGRTTTRYRVLFPTLLLLLPLYSACGSGAQRFATLVAKTTARHVARRAARIALKRGARHVAARITRRYIARKLLRVGARLLMAEATRQAFRATLTANGIQYPEPFMLSFQYFRDGNASGAAAEFCSGLLLNRLSDRPQEVLAYISLVTLTTDRNRLTLRRFARHMVVAVRRCATTHEAPIAETHEAPPDDTDSSPGSTTQPAAPMDRKALLQQRLAASKQIWESGNRMAGRSGIFVILGTLAAGTGVLMGLLGEDATEQMVGWSIAGVGGLTLLVATPLYLAGRARRSAAASAIVEIQRELQHAAAFPPGFFSPARTPGWLPSGRRILLAYSLRY